MLTRRRLAPFAGMIVTGILMAQEPGAVAPQPPTAKAEAAPAKGAADWLRDLGSDDFRVRQQAERALRGLGKEALAPLREAAQSDKDAEVQWRARRLLRQIEQGEGAVLDKRGEGSAQGEDQGVGKRPMRLRRDAQGNPEIEGRFDELFRDLERDFGVDIPRGRFFQDDFFQDLRHQMDDLRAQMQQMQSMGGHGGPGQGRSMQMQMGPSGGEEETKVYEAPDMETFRQKYPGVLEGQGLGGMRMFLGNGPWGGGQAPGAPRLRGQLRARSAQPPQPTQPLPPEEVDQDLVPLPADAQAPPPEGKRLGVSVRPEIPADVRAYLELEDGLGLQVEDVQEGTLAVALGLKRGDILTRIGTTRIGSTSDVQQALGTIEAGQPVEVTVLRRGRETVLTAPKPQAKANAEPKLEKRAAKRDGGEIR